MPGCSSLPSAVTAGSWLSRAAPHSVVLGAELARELKLNVGDPVLVTAQTVNDVTNADEYTIAGLVSTPAPEVNRGGLFIPLDDARVLLDAPSGPGGLVTEVDVALPRAPSLAAALAQGETAASRLRSALPADRIDPIGTLAASYLALRNAKASYSLIPVIIVLIISAVGIVNTILMSVFSRVREIGVLRAYGMTARDIRTAVHPGGPGAGACRLPPRSGPRGPAGFPPDRAGHQHERLRAEPRIPAGLRHPPRRVEPENHADRLPLRRGGVPGCRAHPRTAGRAPGADRGSSISVGRESS